MEKTIQTENKTPIEPIETKEKAVGKCPGCGTQLEMRKFVEVFDRENEQAESTEDLYCIKCHIRWLPEEHSELGDTMPRAENKEIVILNIPPEVYDLLQQKAKEKGKTPSEIVSEIIREKTGNREFEENGIVYETLAIDLPKQIVDFYRFKAHAKGLDDLVESFIAFDICDNLDSDIEGRSPDEWRETFNLSDAFADMVSRENKILKLHNKVEID